MFNITHKRKGSQVITQLPQMIVLVCQYTRTDGDYDRQEHKEQYKLLPSKHIIHLISPPSVALPLP